MLLDSLTLNHLPLFSCLQELLPHVGLGEYTETRKAFFIGYMVHRWGFAETKLWPTVYSVGWAHWLVARLGSR